jgi:hypothetical protein
LNRVTFLRGEYRSRAHVIVGESNGVAAGARE